MRTLAAVIALTMLAGCHEDTQARPIDPRFRGPPPNKPPPLPPGLRGHAPAADPPAPAVPTPTTAGGSTFEEWKPYRDVPDPKAAELEGGFVFEEQDENGLSMYSGHLTIQGDARGATVEHQARERGENPTRFRGTLSAEEAQKLRAEVLALRPWALQNASGVMEDATQSTVSIRLGSVSAQFSFYGGCQCGHSRPNRDEPCPCPQQEVVSLLDAARANAREIPMAAPPAPVRQPEPPARRNERPRQRP